MPGVGRYRHKNHNNRTIRTWRGVTFGSAMPLNEIKEWVLVVSASVSMISVAVGVILALVQYRIKVHEEERLAASSRAEVDIRVLKAFTELMDLAMGRRQHLPSEKAVEILFTQGFISKDDFDSDFTKRQKGSLKLSEYSVIVLPVGASAQEAAVAAIATLGTQYRVLREAAIQGLESLGRGNPKLVQAHLERLNRAQQAVQPDTDKRRIFGPPCRS